MAVRVIDLKLALVAVIATFETRRDLCAAALDAASAAAAQAPADVLAALGEKARGAPARLGAVAVIASVCGACAACPRAAGLAGEAGPLIRPAPAKRQTRPLRRARETTPD